MQRQPIEKPDLSEKGAARDGQPQAMDRRLFMQLLALGNSKDSQGLADALEAASVRGVLYEDLNDAAGVAILAIHEDPDFFIGPLRRMLSQPPFDALSTKPQYTMFGRTYAIGYEPDLEETLFHRPTRTALNQDWPWAIWYPLRRRGEFQGLSEQVQRGILMEHGSIGRAFGEADYAHDIRLACHGLDQSDNDFVIGLTGKELYPLSAIVQTMRKTQQTSRYLERLGPFFVGKAFWQSE